MEGNGRYVYGNGDMYQGQFSAGKRQGAGTYHYKVTPLITRSPLPRTMAKIASSFPRSS